MNGSFPTFHAVIGDILEQRSLSYPHDHVEQLYRARVEEKRLPFESIRPDILEMLGLLKKRHYAGIDQQLHRGGGHSL